MEYVDVLITSRRFAEEYCGTNDLTEAAIRMLIGRRRISAVTSGEDGCVCATPDEVLHVPAFKVDVVDTTGAGDVFHGAFSFALAKEWNVCNAVIFASAAAAIKCTKLGGRQGIPGLEETLSFLRDRGHNLV
jgi:sugar/nucleoside kinase (ribokinase family)